MTKKKSVSSPQEKRIPASVLFTTPISDRQRRQLKRLASMPDSEIDYSDAPERNPFPAEVYVGRFYRPIKQLVSLRVDADVLAWFRAHGKKYQTYMNEVLRREMQSTPARPMRAEYDFSKSRKNPYAKKIKGIRRAVRRNASQRFSRSRKARSQAASRVDRARFG